MIAPEVGLSFVRALCGEEGREARRSNTYTLVLDANPAGRKKIETSRNWCQRTNEDDVDLNRNYGQGWTEQKEGDMQDGVGTKAGRQFEMWSSGSQAFSE